MEAGRPYVFVQIGGERFARRFVDVAARDGDLVGIKSGVKVGERVVTTRDLLGGAHRIWIEHAAERYLLQITRSGKLILTKPVAAKPTKTSSAIAPAVPLVTFDR